MLAHKATHEAKVAAEVIAGEDVTFDARTVPAVAYNRPPRSPGWGSPRPRARAEGIEYEVQRFPWAASGRALGLGRPEGVDQADRRAGGTGRVLGCGIVGVSAGDLISEAVLALEMGADAQDIALTIHPHPTLSETFAFSAEMADGSITDLMPAAQADPRARLSVAGGHGHGRSTLRGAVTATGGRRCAGRSRPRAAPPALGWGCCI